MDNDLRDIKRSIPRDLWLEARSQAVRQDRTIKEWLKEAIEEKIRRTAEEKGKENGYKKVSQEIKSRQSKRGEECR